MALAGVRRRFGYRRLHDLLRLEFPHVNHKKVYRLYREANLAVRRRRKGRPPPGQRQPLMAAQAPDDVWSMDFVSDALASGRRLRCLTVADDFTHECVNIAVDHGISGMVCNAGAGSGGVLSRLSESGTDRQRPGVYLPGLHCLDTAPCHRSSLIEPGKPMQNGYIESFNGKFRDECLNEQWFTTLARLGMSLPSGAEITMKYDRTAAVVGSHQLASLPTIGNRSRSRMRAQPQRPPCSNI